MNEEKISLFQVYLENSYIAICLIRHKLSRKQLIKIRLQTQIVTKTIDKDSSRQTFLLLRYGLSKRVLPIYSSTITHITNVMPSDHLMFHLFAKKWLLIPFVTIWFITIPIVYPVWPSWFITTQISDLLLKDITHVNIKISSNYTFVLFYVILSFNRVLFYITIEQKVWGLFQDIVTRRHYFSKTSI